MQFPISIIIPIYNEEKRLEKGLSRIIEYCLQQKWDFEIIVVEDGCTDQSIKIVKDFCLKEKRIKLLSLKRRCGKGGALIQAIKQCSKDNIGYLDIDLSADPSEFSRLIPFIHTFDLVIGSRVLRDGLEPIKRPRIRNYLSKMYILYFSLLFNVKIYDTQCGFKLFKKDVILPIISTIKINGFAFDTEFLVKSFLHGISIKEVPVIWHHENNSKLNIHKAIYSMSKDLLKIWINTARIQIKNNNIPKEYFAAKPIAMINIIRLVTNTLSESRIKPIPIN